MAFIRKLWGTLTGRIKGEIRLGRQCEENEQFAEAVRHYQSALIFDEKNTEISRLIASSQQKYDLKKKADVIASKAKDLQSKGALKTALMSYRDAQKIFPSKSYTPCIQQLEKLIASYYNANIANAKSEKQKHNFLKAVAYYQKALEYDEKEITLIHVEIAQCKKCQVLVDQANAVVAQGDKLVKERDYRQAIVKYHEALKVWDSESTRKKLENTERQLDLVTTLLQGIKSEREQNYQQAIQAYTRCNELTPSDFNSNRIGICYAKCGEYGKAVENFKATPKSDKDVLYYFGLALMKTGKFTQGYEYWTCLHDQELNKYIAAHKKYISAKVNRLINDIWITCFEDKNYGKAEQMAKSFLARLENKYVKELLVYMQERMIEEQLNQKKLDNITTSSFWIDLTFHQKTIFYFCLAMQEKKYTRQAVVYWISCVYNDPALSQVMKTCTWLDGKKMERAKIQGNLIKKLQQHINQLEQQAKADGILEYLDFELTFVQKLYDLKICNDIILSPSLAIELGRSKEILKVLSTRLNNDEKLFEIGAAYSPESKAFYLFRQGKVLDAKKALAGATDVFSLYVQNRIQFELLIQKLIGNQTNIKSELQRVKALFSLDSIYKKKFLQKFNSVIIRLQTNEKVEDAIDLAQATIDCGLPEAKSTLSGILSHEAVRLINADKISENTALKKLRHALEIDPQNPHAQLNINLIEESIQIRKEMESINRYIKNGDLDGVVRVAKKSKIDKIKNSVLELLRDIIVKRIEEFNNIPYYNRISEYEFLSRYIRPMIRQAESIDYKHPISKKLREVFNG